VPLYEYQCAKCGRFERIQKFSDPTLSTCPTCGEPVQKLLSAPAIQFKGSGWYITDYARKSGGDGKSGSDGNSSAPSSSTKESSTSSKESKDSSSPQTSTSKDSAASGSSSNK
jgi:putative FmdB family regulatory protein